MCLSKVADANSPYSERNARIGSIEDTRRAGK
jgi:hypothetical protein